MKNHINVSLMGVTKDSPNKQILKNILIFILASRGLSVHTAPNNFSQISIYM